MATVTYIRESKQSISAMKGVIDYCCQDKKVYDKISNQRLVSGINCDGENTFAPNIPLGVGVKYKLSRRLNMGLEFAMTKTFSDKIDGKNLSDMYLIKSSFIKNTDWYSNISFSITYEFGERCSTCHYVE